MDNLHFNIISIKTLVLSCLIFGCAPRENNQDEIEIIITGKEDLIIKISDRGKGIKYVDLKKIWYYSYTTLEDNFYNDKIDLQRNSPMAGFGFGLPISRSIIKFLDGDIRLMSMEGYGTDVYITIPIEV